MNIVSRCVQDIVKYGNECKGMIGLVVIAVCLGAVEKRIYCRKKSIECLPAPLTFYRIRKGKQVALGALVVSILIEAAQYVFQCGKTEVDDVILNCLGAMIGYGLFVLGRKGKKLIMECYRKGGRRKHTASL